MANVVKRTGRLGALLTTNSDETLRVNVVESDTYRYDTGTLAFVRWDGSVTVTATVQPGGLSTAADGRQVVTTAGTRVQFASQACKSVAITAELANTGVITVGSSTVVALAATRRGIPLAAGDTGIFAVSNMNLLYMDATVNGEGVTWVVLA